MVLFLSRYKDHLIFFKTYSDRNCELTNRSYDNIQDSFFVKFILR